jgi:2-dehydropantoate 2-reductase
MTEAFPKIAVFGAGAIGCAVSFALARAGRMPTVVARGAALEALRRDGLRVERPEVGGTIRLPATDDTASLGPQDLVIGTMKAQDWPAALPALLPLIGPETTLLPVLNGVPWWYFDGVAGPLAGSPVAAVDPDGTLLAVLKAPRIVGAVVYIGVTRLGPAHARWPGGGRFVVGEAQGPARPRTEAVAALLRQAGFAVGVSNDIRGEVWAKLVGNAPFNSLSALARAAIDEIMNDPGLARIALASMHEVAAVAAALGAPSAMPVEERFAVNAELGAFRTSMLQDFEAGRPLELGALVDAVVELGGKVGVATPMTEALGALTRRAAWLRDRLPDS